MDQEFSLNASVESDSYRQISDHVWMFPEQLFKLSLDPPAIILNQFWRYIISISIQVLMERLHCFLAIESGKEVIHGIIYHSAPIITDGTLNNLFHQTV